MMLDFIKSFWDVEGNGKCFFVFFNGFILDVGGIC